MNEQDYDEDGNNIVPCPICLGEYCPSKEGGKCPREDEFVRGMELEKLVNEKLPCPNSGCDGKGTIAVRISEDEWEPQQCQYCYEIRMPALELARTAYTAGQQDPQSKVVQRARQEGFTAGLESVDALIAEFGYDPKECLKIISEFLSEKVYLTRPKASSAIKEEINKSKV